MQDRYVGDVGDFGKYGLLRALCRSESAQDPALKLGVVWYLTPDETHNNDGRHIGYLNPTPKNLKAFRRCDPELYDMLGGIVQNDQRQVSAIRDRGVLPNGTEYFDRMLDLSTERFHRNPVARTRARAKWCQDALQATKGCDVVFVDPDNGIGSTSQVRSPTGAKYVSLDELIPYLSRGQTLVIYHHLNRRAPADHQIRSLCGVLRAAYGYCRLYEAMRFYRGSARVFFMLSQGSQSAHLERRLKRFLTTVWTAHFRRHQF